MSILTKVLERTDWKVLRDTTTGEYRAGLYSKAEDEVADPGPYHHNEAERVAARLNVMSKVQNS